jgi:pilus assembly protein FimV
VDEDEVVAEAAPEAAPVLPGPPAHALEAAAQPSFRGVFEYPAEPVSDADPTDIAAAGHDAIEAGDAPADGTVFGPAPGRDRLELAIAYLDLGDAETARTLLQEVAVGADPHMQAEARELLARLG